MHIRQLNQKISKQKPVCNNKNKEKIKNQYLNHFQKWQYFKVDSVHRIISWWKHALGLKFQGLCLIWLLQKHEFHLMFHDSLYLFWTYRNLPYILTCFVKFALRVSMCNDQASLVVQMVERICLQFGDLGLIPGLGSSPGEGNGYPFWYSCLENSTNRGAWWATSMGLHVQWLHT